MYKNLEFLSPLADAMTATNPAERPSAADALRQLKSTVSSQNFFTLRHGLVGQKDTKTRTDLIFENAAILVNAALFPVKVVLRIPPRMVRALCGLTSAEGSGSRTL